MNPDSQREAALFQAAVQLTGAARASFLDGACNSNSALRQRLENLLTAHDAQDSLLAEPDSRQREEAGHPDRRRAATMKLDLESAPDEALGTRIGQYKLLQRLGEGGCGVVYMAEQEEPICRRVALKVIKLGMDTKSVVARFEAERQALAMMDHPNIAKVLDAGTTDSGRPFFVMELVRGIKITDYCDQNHLTTEARLELFISICQAVQHAHQKGIIHRDLKPSNILVTMHDGVPVPKVIDFGIAKAIEQKLTKKTLFTELHQFIGTPAYMSPEQAEMSGLDIDTRSDIYSLGVLLYELLTGQTPFDAHELIKAGLDAIRRTIREVEPPRPSTRLSTLSHGDLGTVARARGTGLMGLRSQLRGDLDWIVMKCLEKDRTRRYDTANGLAMDLKRHLTDEPVNAGPPSAAYKFWKFARRNKVALTVAASIATVLVVATGISVWQAVRATRAEQLASERLKESEAVTRFLTEVFQSPDPARDGRTITVAETLNNAAKKLDADLISQPSRRAKLQATLGLTYYALGLFRDAVLLQEKVWNYHLTASGPEHPDTLRAISPLATSYFRAGRRDDSLKMNEAALPVFIKAFGPEHNDTLWVMQNLAICYSAGGRLNDALKMREEILARRREGSGPEHAETLKAMGNLANSYEDANRRDDALKMREEQLALCLKVLGPEHPDTLSAMNNLALSYSAVGRREEALKLKEELLALRRRVLGPVHTDTLRAMNNVAVSYWEDKRWDDALKLLEELLELRRGQFGPEHPETLKSMDNVASILASSPDTKQRNYPRALELAGEVAKLEPKKANYVGTLGIVQYRAGDYAAAIASLEKSLSLRKDGDAANGFILAMARWQMGDKEQARRDYDQASAWLEKETEKDKSKNEELLRSKAEASVMLQLDDTIKR